MPDITIWVPSPLEPSIKGAGGVYALGQSFFFLIMEQHLKSQMVMISCHDFLDVSKQAHMSLLWYTQASVKEDFLKCFSCFKQIICAISDCHPISQHCVYYLRRKRQYIGDLDCYLPRLEWFAFSLCLRMTLESDHLF